MMAAFNNFVAKQKISSLGKKVKFAKKPQLQTKHK